MITPYLRPQDTITQILRRTPIQPTNRRNPVVIGPQYLIQRNDGRSLFESTFQAAGNSNFGYNLGTGVLLDLTRYLPHVSSVSLYGRDLEAKVAAFGASTWTRSGLSDDSLVLAADNCKGGTLNASLDGRSVKIGDVFSVSTGGATAVRRTVTALLPAVTSATPSLSLAATNATTAAASLAEINSGSNANWTTITAVAPVVPFLAKGGSVFTNSAVRRLGEQFTVTCTTPANGTNTDARFSIVGLTSGSAALSVAPTVAGNVFTLALDNAGYAGCSVVLTRSSANPLAGEVVIAKVFPIYTAATTAAVTLTGTYLPVVSRRYVVEVTGGAATTSASTFRIFDTTGEEVAQTGITSVVAGTTSLPIGTSGLSIKLTEAQLCTGTRFYVDGTAVAVSATLFNGVKLSGPILDLATYTSATFALDIFQPYSGVLTNANVGSGNALTAGVLTAGYASALGLPASVSKRNAGNGNRSPFADGIGKIFLSYKAAVIPGPIEGTIAVATADGMAGLVGEPHIENWLGRGVFEAFSGSQSQKVYALRTLDDTVESFAEALRKIRSTDIYYALAVMSDNIDVKQLVITHVEEMSNKFTKNFRRCYVGTDSPGQYLQWGVLASGGYRQASVASQVLTIKQAHRVNGLFVDADFGSLIYIPELGSAPYTITRVISSYEVKISCAMTDAVTDSVFTMQRSDTAANVVRYLQETAATLSSRRCVNVWSDRPTYMSDKGAEMLPAKFIAAEIAGLRCALLPQQGLTMTEITSVTSAPAMYTRFTPDQLDAVSAAGNMVVTQEVEGGDVFIRHQLTTSTTEGALAYEDNVGVIVDAFSYQVKDTFRGYIGKRNATQNTIEEIRHKLVGLGVTATKVDIRDADIGPMVIRFFDEDSVEGSATVRIDGVLADHILTYIRLRVPLPLNGIDHYIDVETSVDL